MATFDPRSADHEHIREPAEPVRPAEPERAGPRFAPIPVRSVGGAGSALAVGSAFDPAEAEADRVSRAVLQRLGAGPEPAPSVHRLAEPEVGADGGDLSSPTRTAIDRLRGAGRPLPEPVRARMEGAFGADFSDVRLHTGAQAGVLNRQLGARAFTAGSDIVLGEGAGDQGVLAHELTHVLQNRGDLPAG